MASLDMINRLAANVPVVNQAAADQVESARKIQLQNAVGQAPAPVNAVRGAQQLAPTSTAAAATNAVQTATANNQGLAKVAATELAAQTADQQMQQHLQALGQQQAQTDAASAQAVTLNRADNASAKAITKDEWESAKRVSTIGLDQDNRLLDISLKQRKELAALGRDVKAKIVDSRLQFEHDEAGRKFSNDRQLSDYAISTAKNEIQLNQRMQDMKQAHDTKIALLEQVNKKLLEAVNQGFLNKEQSLDYEQKKNLLNMHKEIEAQIARDKAEAANTQMIFQGIGTVVGAVAGSVIPGAGTIAGAAVGGAIGSAVGGAVANS